MITITGDTAMKAPPPLPSRRPLVGPFPKRNVQTYCFLVNFMLLLMLQHAYIIYRTSAQQGLKHK